MNGVDAGWVVDKAVELLRSVPLCDNCLGRMFALLGRGLTNRERGIAIKTLVVMELHRRIREGDREAERLFLELAPRLGSVAGRLYWELTGRELEPVEGCYVCGGDLEERIRAVGREAVEALRRVDATRFLVAAHVPASLRAREDELKRLHGLSYAESIGSEVKREVSKIVQRELGLEPEFERPETLVEVDLATWTVRLQPLPLLVRGRYWKLARRVSQSIWVTRRGERRYPFSVEDGLAWLSKLYDAGDVVLHGSGREDADVRMLGTGRPFIVEVKRPRLRGLDLAVAEAEVNRYSSGLVRYRLEGPASRSDVAAIKGGEGRHSKVYHALVVASRPLDEGELGRLEEFFRWRSVRQRTPRRVRHRRPDVVRERMVYSVSTRRLGGRVFEALIHAEGGLYIKELVSGDEGDTVPSFASVLGAEAYCASLDVVAVLPPPAGRG